MKISIIIPCYNEEKRVCSFLANMLEFTKKNLRDYEIVVVNDGSLDKTKEVISQFSKKNKQIKLVSYKPNKGKGYAVKEGVLVAKGEKIIFIDADGSIMPNQLPLMISELDKYDCVVANRNDKNSKVIMTKYRRFTHNLFNTIVKILFQSNIKDNLCGFKGFKKDIASTLFKELHDYGWVFDVEIFYKIKKKGYTLKKIPIEWKHVGDSKMKPLDPIWMFVKLVRLLKFRIPILFEKNGK